MADQPRWYTGETGREVSVGALDDNQTVIRRLNLAMAKAREIADTQVQVINNPGIFAWLDDDLFDHIYVSQVSSPDGSVTLSKQTDIPPRMAANRKDATWYRLAQNVENPMTGQPLESPVIIKAQTTGKWSRLSNTERDRLNQQFTRFLRFLRLPVYSRVANAMGSTQQLMSALDEFAPDQNSWNPLGDSGMYHPASSSPDFVGKANKRMRKLTEGGSHFITHYPAHIGDRDNVIPVHGDGPYTEVRYNVIDNFVDGGIDVDGNVLTARGNTTDGGGDIRWSKAREIHLAQTGNPMPDNMGMMQINWEGRPYWDGQKHVGGVWKMMATVIPDQEYNAMLRRDGMDPASLDMRISSDGLAKQVANNRMVSGRTIWHLAKDKVIKPTPVGGLLSIPGAMRFFDFDQFLDWHFDHVVQDAFKAPGEFQDKMPDLNERIQEILDDVGPENEALLSTFEDSDVADIKRAEANRQVDRFAQNREAMMTGSPYASVGVMDLTQRMGLKLGGMERSSKGAGAIMIPMFKGKRTDAADLPGWVEPAERGMVRLLSRPSRKGHVNMFVFNREDMVDPQMQVAFGGPDNDDEFGAKLARDLDNPDRLYAHVTRDPQSIGGGAWLEVHPDDAAFLSRHGGVVFDALPNVREVSRIHPDMTSIKGVQPQEFPREMIRDIAGMVVSDDPATVARGWERYTSVVTGTGKTAMVTNMDALALRSGWIQAPEDVERWFTELSDSVDMESYGIGTSENVLSIKTDMAIDEINRGSMVDVDLLRGRPGYTIGMTRRVMDRAIEEGLDPIQARNTFLRRLQTMDQGGQAGRLPEWQKYRTWLDGSRMAVDSIENMHNAMSNGPVRWLTAPSQNTPARGGHPFILNDVNDAGRKLSDDWHEVYRDTKRYVVELIKERGLEVVPGQADSVERRQARTDIDELWMSRAWDRIDEMVLEVNTQVTALPDYRDGMLMGSLTQHELIKRSSRRVPEEYSGGHMMDHLRSRVFKEFSHEEKMGFYKPGELNVHPTVVLEYEGTPWLAQRRGGQFYDTRRSTRGSASSVRFHRQEGRLGPYTLVKNPKLSSFLEFVGALGGEFVYMGDVGGRKGYGTWRVQWRDRIFDVAENRYLPLTREKINRWMEDRFVTNAPVDAIPDIFTDPADLQQQVFQTITVGGRQAIVRDGEIHYLEFAFPGGEVRADFPNEPYTVEIPASLKRRIPRKRAAAPALDPVVMTDPTPDPGLSVQPDNSITDRQGPEAPSVPEIDRNPLPENHMADADVEKLLDNVDGVLAEANKEAGRSIVRQKKEGNKKYKPPKPGQNPETVSRVAVGAIGGRDDAFVLMRNLIQEMKDTLTLYSKKESWGAARQYHRRSGITDFIDPDTLEALYYLDEVWFSQTLGNYTSVRDVTRGFQDYANWTGKRNFWYSPAGMQHARNPDQAASLILKDLYMRAEHRVIEREEKGFWYADENKRIVHTGDKTHEVGQRVTGKAAWRALSIGSGAYGMYPEVRFWTNRRFGMEKRVFDYMREMEIPVMFDGDPVRASLSSRDAFDVEVARCAALVGDDIAKLAVLNAVARDMRGVNVLGQDFSPGVIQTASELQDIVKDATEAGKAVFRHLSKVIDGNAEVSVKAWARNGLENTLEGIGHSTLDPAKAIYGDLSPEISSYDRMAGRVKLNLSQDRRAFNSVVSNVRKMLNQGDFIGAGAAAGELLNLRLVQSFRRRNSVYTYATPMDVRSIGGVIPVIRGQGGLDNVYGLLNMDTGVQDRSWNNAWRRIREAMKSTINQSVKKVLGDEYHKSQRMMMPGENRSQKRAKIQVSLATGLFNSQPSSQFAERSRVGASVLLVHRIRWYRALSEGYGAKILSKTMEEHDVPVMKRWLLKDRRDADPVCRGNARNGWIRNNQEFSSGHNQPPAHPGCRCAVKLSIDDKTKVGKIITPVAEPRFLNIGGSRRRRDMNPMSQRTPRVIRDVRISDAPRVIS